MHGRDRRAQGNARRVRARPLTRSREDDADRGAALVGAARGGRRRRGARRRREARARGRGRAAGPFVRVVPSRESRIERRSRAPSDAEHGRSIRTPTTTVRFPPGTIDRSGHPPHRRASAQRDASNGSSWCVCLRVSHGVALSRLTAPPPPRRGRAAAQRRARRDRGRALGAGRARRGGGGGGGGDGRSDPCRERRGVRAAERRLGRGGQQVERRALGAAQRGRGCGRGRPVRPRAAGESSVVARWVLWSLVLCVLFTHVACPRTACTPS